MENFEDKLQEEIDKLPFVEHVDDGAYNDGVLTGFDLGARWACDQYLISNMRSFAEYCQKRMWEKPDVDLIDLVEEFNKNSD